MPSKKQDLEVFLAVYDYAPNINNLLNFGSNMLGMGQSGCFISGVEIGGTEYAFGEAGFRASRPGELPPAYAAARPKERISLGTASFAPKELRRIISRIKAEFPKESHDLLRRNTNHFSFAFAEALGVNPPPPWLNNLAETGSTLGSLLGSFAGALTASAQNARDGSVRAEAECAPVNTSARVPVAKAVLV